MKALNWIYETLAKVIHWLMKIILWPFQMLWKAVSLPIAGVKKLWTKFKRIVSKKIHTVLKKTSKKQVDEKEF